ncbi:MAG: mechanosensitive ion channel [Candidatus Berkelbacteria bacterium]|nr:mechanosensitive ion channel [Candidatus Berkelbacteria bacterium]
MEKLIHDFWQPIANFLPRIPALILTFVVGWLIIKLLLAILARGLKYSKMPKALISVIVSLSSIVVWVILFAEIAREAGLGSLAVTISSSLAILALALATGASGVTSDILAGIFLARDRDFSLGYKIKVGDVEGTVNQVDIRKIRLVDEKGISYIFPNTKLDKDGWQLISREPDEEIEKKEI